MTLCLHLEVIFMAIVNSRRATLLLALFISIAILAAGLGPATAYTVTPEGVRNRLSNKFRAGWDCKNLVIKVIPYQNEAYTRQGRFQSVVISADAMIRQGKGIAVRDIYVKAFDVVFDINKLYSSDPRDPEIVLKSRKRTVLRAKLMETDTNKLLALKKTPIRNLKVDFGNNKLTFTGIYKLVFGNSLKMVGKLQVKDKHVINFVPLAAWVNRVPLPVGPLKQVLSKLNPLVDSYMIPLKPKIDKLTITDKYILIEGNNV